jgi:hypothetical protein
MRTAPADFKVAFLQGLFESAGEVNVRSKAVWVPVPPSHLNEVVRILRDVGVSAHVVGTDPIMVAVDIEDAARIPLFSPVVRSQKYQDAVALAAGQPSSRA